MINPIANAPAASVRPSDMVQAPQKQDPKPDRQAETPPVPKSGELAHDQVTLRSAGQPDTDRD